MFILIVLIHEAINKKNNTNMTRTVNTCQLTPRSLCVCVCLRVMSNEKRKDNKKVNKYKGK